LSNEKVVTVQKKFSNFNKNYFRKKIKKKLPLFNIAQNSSPGYKKYFVLHIIFHFGYFPIRKKKFEGGIGIYSYGIFFYIFIFICIISIFFHFNISSLSVQIIFFPFKKKKSFTRVYVFQSSSQNVHTSKNKLTKAFTL
jgi:hypothetical protein